MTVWLGCVDEHVAHCVGMREWLLEQRLTAEHGHLHPLHGALCNISPGKPGEMLCLLGKVMLYTWIERAESGGAGERGTVDTCTWRLLQK